MAPTTSTFNPPNVNFQAPKTKGFKWGEKARGAQWGPQLQNVKTVGQYHTASQDISPDVNCP